MIQWVFDHVVMKGVQLVIHMGLWLMNFLVGISVDLAYIGLLGGA